MTVFFSITKKTKSNKASSQEPQNGHTPSSKFLKLLDPEASWDKVSGSTCVEWFPSFGFEKRTNLVKFKVFRQIGSRSIVNYVLLFVVVVG